MEEKLYTVVFKAYTCPCGHKNCPLPIDELCEKCGKKLT